MILNFFLGTNLVGYIAGQADGIVTVNGNAAKCDIYVLNVKNFTIVQRSQSLSSGHWLVNELDPNKRYLVMGRDYNREYEPFCWDYVTPATDLTFEQQQELWQSWQTSP